MYKIFLITVIQFVIISSVNSFILRIYHTNDILSRFDELCQEKSNNTGKLISRKCIGGLIRFEQILAEDRKLFNDHNLGKILVFNAGDMATGHLWYSLYRSGIVAAFCNRIEFDAIALGEKEFQDGIYGLKRFLQQLNSEVKVLSANLILDDEPEIYNLNRISKSTIIKINRNNEELKICIVGYTYNKDDYDGNIGRLKFEDAFDAVFRESNHLKYKEKCNFIIALGHSELKTDLRIARKSNVDLVISGHSTNLTEDTTSKFDHYPIQVAQLIYEDQRTVYIGKISPNAQECGRFDFKYDEEGGEGFIYYNSILIDMNFSTNETNTGPIMETVHSYRKQIIELQKEVVSPIINLKEHLEDCKSISCCLGSILSDSMISCVSKTEQLLNIDIDGAIVTANAFIDKVRPYFLTKYKLFKMFTYTENIHLVEIPGNLLLKIFDQSVQNYLTGDFLQVSSSIQVFYNMSSNQVLSLHNVSVNGESVNTTKFYNILITSYLRNGNGGYNEFSYVSELSIIPCYEYEALYQFLYKKEPIDFEDTHNRIKIYIVKDNQAIRLDNLSLIIFFIYCYIIYFFVF